MPASLRMFVPLFLCAAAGAAALAHLAIDIVGDYALPHDTYDSIAHDSRQLVAGIALFAAVTLALRGLRVCCEVAVANRGRLPVAGLSGGQVAAFVAGVVVAVWSLVPAMELLDARLAGTALDGIDDAFGGSMALGLGVSVACAAVVALLIFGIAFWIVSHRDAIETIVVSLMGRSDGTVCPNTQELRRRSVRPHRLGTVYALRLCKRGPPSVAISPWQHVTRSSEGDPRASFSFARVASTARIRDRVVFSGPSRGRPVPSIGSRFTR
jgi:hypothetical protein